MFSIDYKSRTPIYRQVVDSIEKMATHGVLKPEEQLPSVRALAVELSINPNTIAKAYNELEARGIIYSLAGKGSFISDNSNHLLEQAAANLREKLTALAEDAAQIALAREDFMRLCDEAWRNYEEKEEYDND